MTFANQITIGPEFFAKAKNDYACWKWAVAREFCQNSLDARGTREISIDISHSDGIVYLAVRNDGQPMSREVITDKLLPLGSSGKNCEGENIGGMGRAKEVLYFTHRSYRIRTGSWEVNGAGAGYDLEEKGDRLFGTHSFIEMQGNEELVKQLEQQFERFIEMCQRPLVRFFINGRELKGNLKKGTRRREFSWGVVYTNKSYTNRLIVRIGGTTMFTRYVDADDRCVIVELKGKSTDLLTANRDALQDRQRQELDEFIRQVTVDKTSAFRDVRTTYTHFAGEKLQSAITERMGDIVDAAYATTPQAAPLTEDEKVQEADRRGVDAPAELSEGPKAAPTRLEAGQDSVTSQFDVDVDYKVPKVAHDFVIKNNLGMKVPEHFSPYGFSTYSQKLVQFWTAVLLEVHRQFNDSRDFTVGFIFDDEAEAEYEDSPAYGRVFYINPASVRWNSYSDSRSLARRWKFNPEGKWFLVAVSVHEYVHKERSWHDESYANKLTNRMAAALWRRNDFNKCFRSN